MSVTFVVLKAMKMEKRIKGITGYPRTSFRIGRVFSYYIAHHLYLVHFRLPLRERFFFNYCSVMPQPHSGPHGRHD